MAIALIVSVANYGIGLHVKSYKFTVHLAS